MAQSLKDLKAEATKAHQSGDLVKAARAYAAYLTQVPHDAVIWSNLGVLHRVKSQHHMALRAHRRAFALNPNDTGIRNNLANTLSDIGQYEESIKLRRAILINTPDDPNHLAMIGRCLRGMGRYQAAIDHLVSAMDIHPDDAEIQMQMAFALLGKGDYAQAFEVYKARWQAGELKPRNLTFPEWHGEDLSGKSILVMPEQGFGDAILFMRFLPALQAKCGDVRVLVERPLQRLFSKLQGVSVFTAEQANAEKADFWINMMDLAAIHFAKTQDIPVPTQLAVPQDAQDRAAGIVAPHRDKFKVGIIWSGSATYKGNAFRSFSHRDYLALADLPDVQLFSLYKGPYLEPFRADGSDAFIVDAASTDRDFADCAAMMNEMDLVITSDTVSAHMAGSLAVETWTVLHWDPFWVWRHVGDETLWYPGMRLFRQRTPLDWLGVMADIREALIERLEAVK